MQYYVGKIYHTHISLKTTLTKIFMYLLFVEVKTTKEFLYKYNTQR